MSFRTSAISIRSFLLDIEGTTTPIDFVYDILFPFARDRIKEYLTSNWGQASVQADVASLIAQHSDDARRGLAPPRLSEQGDQISVDSIVAYVRWLMDHDRKVTSLKTVQGKVWEEGYLSGKLKSQVFDDVPRAFERWHKQGRMIRIYSSGSALAQKLLFSSTPAGDLTQFISGYYDTNIGAKKDPDSYRRIAAECETEASELLFLSDVVDELDAASIAGLQTILCVRPGNHPQPSAEQHSIIHTFDEVP